MFRYVFKRLAVMLPTLVVISFIIFVIIQLPPGDYLETHIAELESQGESVDPEKIEFLRRQYGLDQPFAVQYVRWVGGFFHGDWGYSFEHVLELCLLFKITHGLCQFPTGIFTPGQIPQNFRMNSLQLHSHRFPMELTSP